MAINMVLLGQLADEVSAEMTQQSPGILASLGIRNEPCPPEVCAELHQMVEEIKARRPTK